MSSQDAWEARFTFFSDKPVCVEPTAEQLSTDAGLLMFIQRFVHSFAEPPSEITLDVDLFDDPTHGQQQLTFFHGFYDQYQYLVRSSSALRGL